MSSPSDSEPAALEQLSANERRLLAHVAATGATDLAAAAAAIGMQPVQARSAASWLQAKGLLELSESSRGFISASEEAIRFAKIGFPEMRLWDALASIPAGVSMDQAAATAGLEPAELQIALAWWQRKGLGRIEKGTEVPQVVANKEPADSPDAAVLAQLVDGPVPSESLDNKGLAMLRQRKGLIIETQEKAAIVRLASGISLDATALAGTSDLIEEVTPELLKSGQWKGRTMRPFDVHSPVPRIAAGKPHPLQQIIQEVRQVFLELGFAEISYDYVQSAFWNMDALFIPQDHPAREMQDTFYLERPASVAVPEKWVDKVAAVHESGGDTGSRGWGSEYSRSEASRALLRTHTTVGTIRYLAANPYKACRVFSVDRVFRKETMDATHLPEFHQVEGIATEPGINFRHLLGILKEFYSRLGFDKLRWRPAYFPYTEPSMEIEVFYEGKWMELGGSGVFRPEVTEPLGVPDPVIAWGLGLERLAMMRLGLSDIRDLYVSDMEWLRRQPLG